MTVSIYLVAILPALLVAAAMFDLTSYTIPNTVPAAMVVLFAIFLLSAAINGHAMSASETSLHFLAGLVGLFAGIALFAMGWVGGGDAKLFAAAALWLGWDALYEYTLISSILGGVLTVLLIAIRRASLPAALAAHPWLVCLTKRDADIPYGIALSFAALAVLPNTAVFQLAAAG